MKFRRLEGVDFEVSVIGMGCWQFAGGAMWGSQEDRDSIEAVHAALDGGITLFDTAEGYGNGKSEEVLGEALRKRRSRAIVATKSGGPTYSREEMFRSCEASLRRLKTDYIDIYQLHWPRDEAVSPDLIIATATELIERGKIRAFGVCNYGPRDLEGILAHGRIVTDQLAYSPLWRGIEAEVVPILADHRVGILCYSTLIHGLLSGRYATIDELPEGRRRTLHFSSDREGVRHGQKGEEALTNRTLAEIARLCDRTGVSMSDAAYGWAATRPQVSSVLAGARNVEQAVANARLGDLELPGELVEGITEATEELKESFGSLTDMWQVPGRMK
jgi:myo-inositol catabolism protein IolS